MSDNMLQQVTQYNKLVEQYHELDTKIDNLLESHQGHSENMTDESRALYRKLANQRDDVFNQMRAMEQTLFSD